MKIINKTPEELTEQDMFEIEINDIIICQRENSFAIQKVPGGWTYIYPGQNSPAAVFVPNPHANNL
jgi:hypothetical protein